MNLIRERANNEKYFAAIKYYYHTSGQDAKVKTFDTLLEENIFLAAHCIVTDAPNDGFLKRAIATAVNLSKDFTNETSSSKALLALAELKQFDQIIETFDKIKKPAKLHFAVLNRVFQQADQETFLKFIETFVKSQSLKLYATSFLQYPNQLELKTEVLETLQPFIAKLYNDLNFGVLKAFLEKHQLYDFLEFFFGKTPIAFCEELLHSVNSRDLIFAFAILKKFSLFRTVGVERIIETYSNATSNKTLKFALMTAVEYEVYENIYLDFRLSKLFANQSRIRKKLVQNAKLVAKLINHNLVKYLNKTNILTNQFLDFCYIYNIRLYSGLDMIVVDEFSKDPTQYFGSMRLDQVLNSIFTSRSYLESNQDIYSFWKEYFGTIAPLVRSFPIEPVLEKVNEFFESDYRTHFKVLRQFVHEGYIQSGNDTGQLVYPKGFRSIKQLFLHNQQIQDFRAFPTRFDMKISFRLIGYNQENKRLNVSEFALDVLEQNSIAWEKGQANE